MRKSSLLLTLLIACSMVLVWGAPSWGACHIAGFTEDAVTVAEDAGTVTLTVELQGRTSSCSGQVEYETLDGTATARSDFNASNGTLVFEEGDDRVEEIEISIINDSEPEQPETFQVALSIPEGDQSISGTGSPAEVTITDDDGEAPPAATSPSPSPSPTEALEASPDATPLAEAASGGIPSWVIVAIIVLVVVLILAVVLLRRRGSASS